MIGIHVAAVTGRGVMSFTVPTGQHLRLGGANPTVPTTYLSTPGGATFLSAGIPQAQTDGVLRFAEPNRDTNGHAIKHARIRIVSTAGAVSPGARFAYDGSTPDATHGERTSVGDVITLPNTRGAIFLFDLINISGGDMEIDVTVDE